jgi:hypothetical protein
METATISAALRPISETLACDGYGVDVELADAAVSVRVTAGPDACKECLVPKSLMAQLVLQALGDAGIGLAPEQVHLTYPDESS